MNVAANSEGDARTIPTRGALVTGAAAGLGAGIVRRLARDGWGVVAVDRAAAVVETLARVGAELGLPAGRLVPIVGDVADPATSERAVGAAVAAFDGLDLVVANAGIGGPADAVVDLDPADFDGVLAVNLSGTFLTCRAAGRAMLAAGRGGSIVTIASIFAHRPAASTAAYSASKAAIVAFSQTLALELGPQGIRVNAISPGNMATEMHWEALRFRAERNGTTFEEERARLVAEIPLRRHGTPDDIAGAVAFLASDDAAYITGTTVLVDGGFLAE